MSVLTSLTYIDILKTGNLVHGRAMFSSPSLPVSVNTNLPDRRHGLGKQFLTKQG